MIFYVFISISNNSLESCIKSFYLIQIDSSVEFLYFFAYVFDLFSQLSIAICNPTMHIIDLREYSLLNTPTILHFAVESLEVLVILTVIFTYLHFHCSF